MWVPVPTPAFQPILHGPQPPKTVADGRGTVHIQHVFGSNYLVATPEEWVRQNLLLHLQAIGYPPGLIATEREVRVGRIRRRFDVLVYDAQTRPFLVAECKAAEIPITSHTHFQAADYNQVLKAQYVLLTNGRVFQVFAYTENGYSPLEGIPCYQANL
jgi:Type I restriction enzyme R protein N terminus (HSDR_N)